MKKYRIRKQYIFTLANETAQILSSFTNKSRMIDEAVKFWYKRKKRWQL